jgi:hypothetical protein
MKRVCHWKVYTAGLLGEIMNNSGAAILRIPLVIFGRLLAQVAERAAELNDPKLNALMMQLGLYSVADPMSPEYDPRFVDDYLHGDMKHV